MLRYRCPKCTHLLQAHELRAGKKSVCVACLSTHIIPIDRTAWLTEEGEPLFSPASSAEPQAPAAEALAPAPGYAAAVIGGERDAARGASSPSGSPLSAFPEQDTPPIDPTRGPSRMDVTPPPRQTPEALAPLEGQPVHVQTQVEIAMAITEAIAHRMKPPRNPRRDLRVSTAAWLVLTGISIAFILVTLATSANYARRVFMIGVIEAAIGYGWIVWLASQRDPRRGVACAVPPITFYYLGQWKYARFRPLRFVLTGFLLVIAAFVTVRVSPAVREMLGKTPAQHAKPADPATMSSLERLREYREQKAYDPLLKLLHDLAKTDSLKSVDAKDGPELARELRFLCDYPDTAVKVAAMAAYARWGGSDARDVCLNAIKAESWEERMKALELLPQWKGSDPGAPEVARAVASLIGRPKEGNRAKEALIEIGGVAAERAALGLFLRNDDLTLRLLVLTILEEVGGAESIEALRAFAVKQVDPTLKTKTLETVEAIQLRQPK